MDGATLYADNSWTRDWVDWSRAKRGLIACPEQILVLISVTGLSFDFDGKYNF